MSKNCVICSEKIFEEFGKLLGTLIKTKNEKGNTYLIPVCSDYQKKDDWINTAKIKGV